MNLLRRVNKLKKKEFLNLLKKKLDILENAEVEDILKEYEGYIHEKMEKGVSEEDAIESFGDIDELVEELLRAYKIKVRKESDPIGDFTKKVIDSITIIVNDISEKSSKDILKFVLEICILLFVIGLCHIPVSMLISLGKDVFYILSSPINRIFFMIWKFVLEFAYLILSILVFARIFDKRYLRQEKQEVSQVKKKEKVVIKENLPNQTVLQEKKFFPIGEVVIKIMVVFLKFIAICILFATSAYLIGMAVVLGICVYLIIEGVTYFGIYMVMLALFLLGTIFFHLLFNFVINKKNHGVVLFTTIMLSILLLGLGSAVATLEVSDTEFINSAPNDLEIEVLTEELPMNKNTVFLGNIANYKVDNELDFVKVEYEYYPLGTKMSTNISKNDQFVRLSWNLERINFNSGILKHMIQDLREKKVYNYHIEPTITITSNEENIEQIKKNRQKYFTHETNYSSCEFVRTYTVEIVRFLEDSREAVVVLSQYLEEDLVSVHIKKEFAENLVIGNAYEFTFKTYQSYIDTDIENVFSENEVVNVKQTLKKGIEQRQDNSCTLFY